MSEIGARRVMVDETATPYGYLVDALNFLEEQTGTEVVTIEFNKSDVPVDWDEEAGLWFERRDV